MSEKISDMAEEAKAARQRIATALEGFQSNYRNEALLKYELERAEIDKIYRQYDLNYGRLEQSLETLGGAAEEIVFVCRRGSIRKSLICGAGGIMPESRIYRSITRILLK